MFYVWFYCRHSAGKKQMRKARDELRKEIEKLKKELHHQKKQKEKYKKRLQRVSKSQDSPRSKVGHLLKNCTVNNRVRKTLLHHEVLIANIRRKYQNASNEKKLKIHSSGCCGEDSEKIQDAGVVRKSLRLLKETLDSPKCRPGQLHKKLTQQVCR